MSKSSSASSSLSGGTGRADETEKQHTCAPAQWLRPVQAPLAPLPATRLADDRAGKIQLGSAGGFAIHANASRLRLRPANYFRPERGDIEPQSFASGHGIDRALEIAAACA